MCLQSKSWDSWGCYFLEITESNKVSHRECIKTAPGIPGADSGGGKRKPAPGIPGANRPRFFTAPDFRPRNSGGSPRSGAEIGGSIGGGNRPRFFPAPDFRPRFPPPEFRGWTRSGAEIGGGIGGGNGPRGIFF